MIRPISEELANQLYDILVEECQAHEGGKEMFVVWATSDYPGNEYRFGGIFGMAGKIWLEHDGVRISGPNHRELEDAYNSEELEAAVKNGNRRIQELLACI